MMSAAALAGCPGLDTPLGAAGKAVDGRKPPGESAIGERLTPALRGSEGLPSQTGSDGADAGDGDTLGRAGLPPIATVSHASQPRRRGPGPEIKELKAELAADPERVGRAILSHARVDGNELKGELANGDWIAIRIKPPKKGDVCTIVGVGKYNNIFNALVAVCGGVSEACRWAERWTGAGGWEPAQRQRRAAERAVQREQEQEDAERRENNLEKRRCEYANGTPATADSRTGRYLAGRGCRQLSPVLRDVRSGGWDAMMAPVVLLAKIVVHRHQFRQHRGSAARPEAPICAYHRTLLDDEGESCRKASVKLPLKPKMTFGPTGGGVIPLLKGASGLGLREALNVRLREKVVISEGIEDALTAELLHPELRILAAAFVGNFVKVDLPSFWKEVVLVRDCETKPHSGGPRARANALERWLREGRRVIFLDPPPGFADLNDAARALGADGTVLPPQITSSALWAQAGPVAAVAVAADYCARLLGGLLPAGLRGGGDGAPLRAHPGVTIGAATWPAFMAWLVDPHGARVGLHVQLLTPDRPPLLRTRFEWGERRGAAIPLTAACACPDQAVLGVLGVGLDTAIACAGGDGPVWSATGWDHLPEVALPKWVRQLRLVLPKAGARADERVLVDWALARLRAEGREVTEDTL